MFSIIRLYKNSFSGLSRSIWLLSMITLINRSGTMVIPFLSVYLTQELNLSKGQTGLVITMFGLGSMIGSYLGGFLTDKIGYFKVLALSLIAGGGLFIGLDFIQSYHSLLLYILLLSIVAESYRPASMVAVSVYSKPENTTRSFGLLRFAINLGFSLGPALGGLLAATAGFSWLFWVDGITCISAGILFSALLRPKATSLKEEKEELEDDNSIPERSVFKDHRYLFFLLTGIFSSIVFVQFNSVIPVYFKEEIFLSEAMIGLVLASNGILITLMEMPLVYSLENKFSHLRIILVGYAFLGLCYLAFLFLPPLLFTALFAIGLLTIGEMLCFPFGNTYALQHATPKTRGKYMALYTISWSIAHISAPTLGFQIVERFSYNTLWIVLMVLAVVACLGIWLLDKGFLSNKS